MSRALLNLDPSVGGAWIEAATAVVTLTIQEVGRGVMYINDEEVVATAEVYDKGKMERVQQNSSAKTTYLKATGLGWRVIADTP